MIHFFFQAELLYEQAGKGVGKRLTHDALCEICVRNKCRIMKLHHDTTRDAKIIIDHLRSPDDGWASIFLVSFTFFFSVHIFAVLKTNFGLAKQP